MSCRRASQFVAIKGALMVVLSAPLSRFLGHCNKTANGRSGKLLQWKIVLTPANWALWLNLFNFLIYVSSMLMVTHLQAHCVKQSSVFQSYRVKGRLIGGNFAPTFAVIQLDGISPWNDQDHYLADVTANVRALLPPTQSAWALGMQIEPVGIIIGWKVCWASWWTDDRRLIAPMHSFLVYRQEHLAHGEVKWEMPLLFTFLFGQWSFGSCWPLNYRSRRPSTYKKITLIFFSIQIDAGLSANWLELIAKKWSEHAWNG